MQLFYAYEEAERILRAWPTLALSMPESVTPQIILWSVPADGGKVVVVIGLYAGPAEAGAAVLGPLRSLGTPLFEQSGTMRYVDVQSSVDGLFPTGGRYYMKSHMMNDLSSDTIATLLEWDARRPTPETLVAIRTLGGAVSRVSAAESAFPHRSAPFNVSLDAGWTDPAIDDTAIGWARGAWDALRPFATGGMYVNFSGLGDEIDSAPDAVFGKSQEKLAQVRATYDPEGLFAAAARRP